MKLIIILLLFTKILSAQALGEFYSAKIQGKEYHVFVGLLDSYLYQVGSSQTYFLKKEILLGTIKKFEIFESNQRDKSVGYVSIAGHELESFELNQIKAKKVKIKKLNLPVEQIILPKQIYNNDKCSFQFIDLVEVKNVFLFKELAFLISEVMDAFKDYECDYLKSSRSKEMKSELNQLVCANETILLKNRFYGITFECKASMAKSSSYKHQVFSIIFDKSLKARVSKADFTDSDITAEDDYRNLAFRLTPAGLALFSTDMLENKEEYVRIIPYFDIKKHFSIWGKPKRYLSFFVLK